MSFITQTEAETNVDGFSALSDSDKARYLAQSSAYLIARNVQDYSDVTLVPDVLKLASYEVIRGIMAGSLYQGKTQTLTSKEVSAQSGTSVKKSFADGSVELNAYEQYINDLIYPYASRPTVRFLRRL